MRVGSPFRSSLRGVGHGPGLFVRTLHILDVVRDVCEGVADVVLGWEVLHDFEGAAVGQGSLLEYISVFVPPTDAALVSQLVDEKNERTGT